MIVRPCTSFNSPINPSTPCNFFAMLGNNKEYSLYLPQSHVRKVVENLDDLKSKFNGSLEFIDGQRPKILLSHNPNYNDIQSIANAIRALNNTSSTFEKELKIDKQYHGFVLGQHGNTLKTILLESGCDTITIKEPEYNSTECTVVFKSYAEPCVQMAFDMIQTMVLKVAQQNNAMSHKTATSAISKKIYINDAHVGAIIGVQGRMVQYISQNANCQVSIDQLPGREKQIVNMTGLPRDIEYCKELINDAIGQYEANLNYTTAPPAAAYYNKRNTNRSYTPNAPHPYKKAPQPPQRVIYKLM